MFEIGWRIYDAQQPLTLKFWYIMIIYLKFEST
jgi:hypothetical protein